MKSGDFTIKNPEVAKQFTLFEAANGNAVSSLKQAKEALMNTYNIAKGGIMAEMKNLDNNHRKISEQLFLLQELQQQFNSIIMSLEANIGFTSCATKNSFLFFCKAGRLGQTNDQGPG